MTTKVFMSACLLIALMGCSSIKVTSDQDKEVDFSKYKTYSFLGWQDGSDKIINEFDKERLRKAFQAEQLIHFG